MMVYYTKGNINMVKLLKQSSISFALRNTRVNGWTTKAITNANPVNDIQTKYQVDRTKDNIF